MNEQILSSWSENAENWINLDYSPERICDIGCGEGWLTRVLSELSIEAVGVDGTQQLIERAKEEGSATFHTQSYEDIISTGLCVADCEAAFFLTFVFIKMARPWIC